MKLSLCAWTLALRAAALLSLLLLTLVTVIRAQPYDDTQLRRFLLPPDGCAAPCFLGAQPGAAVDPAVADLAAHDWVAEVSESADFYDIAWSGMQPNFVNAGGSNYLFAPLDRVMLIRLQTRLRLGDIMLALGRPDSVFLSRTDFQSFNFHLLYQRWGLQASAFMRCPNRRQAFWSLPMELRLETRLSSFESEDLGIRALHIAC